MFRKYYLDNIWGPYWCNRMVFYRDNMVYYYNWNTSGMQCFKMARLQLAPFGKEVVTVSDSSGNLLMNILWLIFGGLELCITNIVSGLILCITIVGIPFAAQSFKMAKLALMPFGKEVI